MPIPAEYADPPLCDNSKLLFMVAFQDLNLDRPLLRDTVSRLTRRDVWAWADDYGFSDDLSFKMELLAHIRAMDAVWVEIELDRKAKEAKRRPQGTQTRGKKNVASKFRPTP